MPTTRGVRSSRLPPAFVERVATAVGLPVQTVGWCGLRSPLTNRIWSDLQLLEDQERLLSTLKVQLAKAQFHQQGINGHKFKRIKTNALAGINVYELKLPFNLDIGRMQLNLGGHDVDGKPVRGFLADFFTHAGVDPSSRIRLSAELCESGRWVSERYMSGDQLLGLDRMLFMGSASGTAYSEFEQLSKLRVTVVNTVGAALQDISQVPPFLRVGPKSKTIKLIINPDDDLCGQRMLAFHLASENRRKKLLKFLNRLKADAEKLGIPGAMGPPEFEACTEQNPEWGVIVFDSFSNVKFACKNQRSKIAYGMYQDVEGSAVGHYHVAINPDGFHDATRFCQHCLKFIARASFPHHKCDAFQFRCEHCEQRWETERELNAHRAQVDKKPVCDRCKCWAAGGAACHALHNCSGKRVRCMLCTIVYPMGTEHVCNTFKCKNCKEMVSQGHRCYIQTIDLPRRKWKIVIYDYEADTVTHDCHKVMAVSWVYLDEPETEMYLSGWDCLERYVAIMLKMKMTIFVAHNGKSYDMPLTKQELERQHGFPTKIIKAGTKIMRMELTRGSLL